MTAEQRYLRIVSGEARGAPAAVARAGLSLLSPLYGAAVHARNMAFDRGWRHFATLPRPAVSVGNLTVGGTGKTPVVAWLCQRLLSAGHRPAVLMRGYKAQPGQKGDEQRLLEELLGPQVPVGADADRVRAAERVMAHFPETSLFILDDAFQHRRVRRHFDLVLIDATRPFGHGRLLPRGLLREPLTSLRRAMAVLITRAELATPTELEAIEAEIRSHTSAAIYRCGFSADRLLTGGGRRMNVLEGTGLLAVCGIGNPDAFLETLRRRDGQVRGSLIFSDHHAYSSQDVQEIRESARAAGATPATTAKDWVKLQKLWPEDALEEILIVEQSVTFAPGDDQRLLDHVIQMTTLYGENS